MKKAKSLGVGIAAILPAAMVPIALPALQSVGAADLVKGGVAGVLLGASLLLLMLALTPRHA